MFLVFEYVEHDLAGLIDNMKKPFTEPEVKCLLLQLLRAVHYLHKNYYIHRQTYVPLLVVVRILRSLAMFICIDINFYFIF